MKRIVVVLSTILALLCFVGCSSFRNPSKMPFGSTDYMGMQREEIVSQLEDAGFTNVTINEIKTTEEDKSETVASVTVDGKTDYQKNTTFEADAAIEVEVYVLEELPKEKIETPQPEKLKVYLETSVEGEQDKPVFSVRTNLPDGTVISMELDDDTTVDMTQQDVVVKNGKAVSEPFEIKSDAINDTFYFSMMMLPGSEQPDKVNEIVGESGELLDGEWVEEYIDGYYCIAAYYDYDVQGQSVSLYQSQEESEQQETATEDSPEQVKAALKDVLSGFGENCTISLEGYLYTVNVWQDGLANTALLATMGNASGIEAWNKVVQSTEDASENLQIIVMANGGENYMVQLNLLNDQNTDNVLLTAMWGETTYNCVS